MTPFAEELNQVEGSYRAGGGNAFSRLQRLAARLPKRAVGDRNWNTWERKAGGLTRIVSYTSVRRECKHLTRRAVASHVCRTPLRSANWRPRRRPACSTSDERPKTWPGKASRSKEDRQKGGEGTVVGGVCMATFPAALCTSRLTASSARFLAKLDT